MDIKNKYYVYRHYIEGNTFYVGKGQEDRAYVYGRNKIWKEIVEANNNKYDIEIIKYFNNEKEAYEFEKELTEKYKKNNQCKANIMIGKGSLRGVNNGMYGKNHSEDTKNKISKALTGKGIGKKISQETIQKILTSRSWYKHSEETKNKISLNHADFKGEKHPRYGKKASKETIEKLKLSNLKYKDVYIIIDGEKLTFKTSKIAAKYLHENIFLDKTYDGIERSIRNSIRLSKKLYKKYEVGCTPL